MSSQHRIPKTYAHLWKADATMSFPLDDASVQLVVTSPPYWHLKNYKCQNQIGITDTFESFINNLQKTWKESRRVLKDGGYLCIVASDLKNTIDPYFIQPINAFLVAGAYSLYFNYEGSIIWRKIARGGTIPENVFPTKFRFNYEMIHIFRKGERKDQYNPQIKSWTNGIIYTPNPTQHAHPATFPIAIPRLLISSLSSPGDVVLDPFAGTGTTGVAALQGYRNFIGLDLSDEYLEIARANLNIKISPRLAIQRPVHLNVCEKMIDMQNKTIDDMGKPKII